MEDIYFDSHTHLSDEAFDADRADVIRRAHEAGAGHMLVVGGDVQSNLASIKIAGEDSERFHAAVGFHPNSLREVPADWRDELEKAASDPGVVALGETGLDLYRDRVPLDEQLEGFCFHLELSASTGLPVIIHQRNAEEVVLDALRDFAEKHGPVKGVMHCFTGGEEYAAALSELGMYISFSGTVSYPRNRTQRHALARIPENKLLIETDAPYLSPEGHRGERCEPWMVTLVAKRVAQELRLDQSDVARITRRNALGLFGIDFEDPPAAVYPIRQSLYINLTNRCSNACVFCPRTQGEFILKGHNLKLDEEPSVDELLAEVERQLARRDYREVVFCGFGEPTLRLDVLLAVGKALRLKGMRVRLDTNGHASLVNEQDVVRHIKEAVDEVSISLNATDAAQYVEMCRPSAGEKAFDALKEFTRRAVEEGIETTVTVVSAPGVDVKKAREIAASLGAGFRVRQYNRVG